MGAKNDSDCVSARWAMSGEASASIAMAITTLVGWIGW